MLKKAERLSRKQLNYIFRKGKKKETDFFIAKFLPGKTSRFAVVVSATLLAKAVERNHLRQQLYEIIRVDHQELVQNIQIVLIAKKNILELSNFEEKKKSIISIFKKIAS